MTILEPIKTAKRPRIGLYSVGHPHYWDQFKGLLDRLLGYNRFIAQRMAAWGDVCNVGMIDGFERGEIGPLMGITTWTGPSEIARVVVRLMD